MPVYPPETGHHPGDIRAFDQVLVDHFLERGFVIHALPPGGVFPLPVLPHVTILHHMMLWQSGGADIWWWHGPTPPDQPNAPGSWETQMDHLRWVWRQRVLHYFPQEATWDVQLQQEMDYQLEMFRHDISQWVS